MTKDELLELARKIRYDLTACQGKLSDLMREIAALEIPDARAARCHCGLSCRGPAALAEHVYLAHDGPVPAHWERAEALAAD